MRVGASFSVMTQRRTRALILGKFLPPHRGHRYLAEAARDDADDVIIALPANSNVSVPTGRHSLVQLNRSRCTTGEPSASPSAIDVVVSPDPARPTTAIRRGRPDSPGSIKSVPYPPIGSLGPSSDPQDDDERGGVVDQVDDAQVPDPQPPEVRAGQLRGTPRPRVEPQCEDRTAKSSRISRRKPTELTLDRRSEVDSMAAFAHASSVP